MKYLIKPKKNTKYIMGKKNEINIEYVQGFAPNCIK